MINGVGLRTGLFLYCVAVLIFFSSALIAQQGGKYQDLLASALNATAQGHCPSGMMTPLLRSACEDQQPAMGQQIQDLGSIKSFEFMGTQNSQMGPVEVYRVRHEFGNMTWMINTDSDGKILVLWTPG